MGHDNRANRLTEAFRTLLHRLFEAIGRAVTRAILVILQGTGV